MILPVLEERKGEVSGKWRAPGEKWCASEGYSKGNWGGGRGPCYLSEHRKRLAAQLPSSYFVPQISPGAPVVKGALRHPEKSPLSGHQLLASPFAKGREAEGEGFQDSVSYISETWTEWECLVMGTHWGGGRVGRERVEKRCECGGGRESTLRKIFLIFQK